MKLTFEIKIEDGKLIMSKFDRQQIMDSMKNGFASMTVEQKHRRRSNPLNRYYWGVVVKYVIYGMAECGNDLSPNNADDVQTVHEFLKSKFLSKKRNLILNDGVVEGMTRSTKKLTNDEFIAYIDKIMRWSSVYLNILIPTPDEQYSGKHSNQL